MEEAERLLILAVYKRKKPSCRIMYSSSDVPDLARKFNLEFIEVAGTLSCVVAQKDVADSFLKNDIIEEFSSFPFISRLRWLAMQCRGKTIIEAQLFIEDYDYERKGQYKFRGWTLETPEGAVCKGLLYGYPVCCIRYYVETRFFNKDQASARIEPNQLGCIPCEKCYTVC